MVLMNLICKPDPDTHRTPAHARLMALKNDEDIYIMEIMAAAVLIRNDVIMRIVQTANFKADYVRMRRPFGDMVLARGSRFDKDCWNFRAQFWRSNQNEVFRN